MDAHLQVILGRLEKLHYIAPNSRVPDWQKTCGRNLTLNLHESTDQAVIQPITCEAVLKTVLWAYIGSIKRLTYAAGCLNTTLKYFTNASSIALQDHLHSHYAISHPNFHSLWARDFSLLHNVQISPGTHSDPYPTGTEVVSPRVKYVFMYACVCIYVSSNFRVFFLEAFPSSNWGKSGRIYHDSWSLLLLEAGTIGMRIIYITSKEWISHI
jgi:hypothetical protein